MINYNSYTPAVASKQQARSQTLSQATGKITPNYKLDWMPNINEDRDTKEDSLLRTRRNTINGEILKQLRLRTGAENMLEALRESKDKTRRKVLEMELSFVDSNLQLLKEALAEINCPVLSDGMLKKLPVVPLALKQSSDIDVKVTFLDFILEHYSEDATLYEKGVDAFQNLRRDSLEVKPDAAGIQCLTDYCNQLYYIEHRFFPNSRNMAVYFQWYDAISGFPSIQSSIAFEKGSILYNLGALWSQIGAKQNREERSGCKHAASAFSHAAGYFSHLRNNFSESPTRDMASDTLEFFASLMMAQAQECLYELFCLNDDRELSHLIRKASESAEVADGYDVAYICLKNQELQRYIPQAWRSLISIKSLFYRAMSQSLIAESLLHSRDTDSKILKESLSKVLVLDSSTVTIKELNSLLASVQGKKRLARSHLRSSLRHLEDSLRKHRSCKMLRKIDIIQKILHYEHESTLQLLSSCEDDRDFIEVVSPSIRGSAVQRATPVDPDYASFKTTDFFRDLGPLTVFSANSRWSAPRTVSLVRSPKGYGCTLCGSSPVSVQHVEENSVAKKQGLQNGDFIVKLYGNNVKWAKHQDVIDTILTGNGHVEMEVVSPQSILRIPISHSLSPPMSGRMSTSIFKELSLSSSNISMSAMRRTNEKKERDKKSISLWEKG